jgi:hypothetical protein
MILISFSMLKFARDIALNHHIDRHCRARWTGCTSLATSNSSSPAIELDRMPVLVLNRSFQYYRVVFAESMNLSNRRLNNS